MWPWSTGKGEPTTFSRTRHITRPTSVDRKSTRLTNNSAPQITLRTRISRPLKCTRTQPCSGVHGADGAWAGDRWEWESASGGLDEQDCLKFHESPFDSITPPNAKRNKNQSKPI